MLLRSMCERRSRGSRGREIEQPCNQRLETMPHYRLSINQYPRRRDEMLSVRTQVRRGHRNFRSYQDIDRSMCLSAHDKASFPLQSVDWIPILSHLSGSEPFHVDVVDSAIWVSRVCLWLSRGRVRRLVARQPLLRDRLREWVSSPSLKGR